MENTVVLTSQRGRLASAISSYPCSVGLKVTSSDTSLGGLDAPASVSHATPKGGMGMSDRGYVCTAGRHLNEFATVNTNGKISSAANRINTVQPSASNAILRGDRPSHVSTPGAAVAVAILSVLSRLDVGPLAHEHALKEREGADDHEQDDGCGRGQAHRRPVESVLVHHIGDGQRGFGRTAGGDHVDLVQDLEAANQPQCDHEKGRRAQQRHGDSPKDLHGVGAVD